MSKVRVGSARKHSSVSNYSTKESVKGKVDKKSQGSFDLLFKMLCFGDKLPLPNIMICQKEPSIPNIGSSSTITSKQTIKAEKDSYDILAIYDNPEKPNNLNSVIIRNYDCGPILKTLSEIFLLYSTLTTIKLEFCLLNNAHIIVMQQILIDNEQIVDVSLNGNSSANNFYLLVENTNLLSLSLRYCNLGDEGVTILVNKMKKIQKQPLAYLILSSNNITDVGVQEVATMLRTNRTLLYLGLADNYISDIGCKSLMNILMVFELTHEEIVLRRKINMEYLKSKNSIEESKEKNSLIRESTTSSRRSSATQKRKSIISAKKNKKRSSSAENTSTSCVNEKLGKKGKSDTLSSLEGPEALLQFSHLYMKECFKENKTVYCNGNFVLQFVNLAYNNITKEGVEAVSNMLKYQKSKEVMAGAGIQKVIIDGNPMPNLPEEVTSVQSVQRSSQDVKSTSSQKKKSGSKTSANF